MAVKSNLKQIRTDRNIQQHELATALQTDVRTISRYETGARCPNIEMALRLFFAIEKCNKMQCKSVTPFMVS